MEDRQRDALRLMESYEGEFAKILDSSPLLFWVTDRKRRSHFVNKTFQEFSGYDMAELSGRKWLHYIHPEYREQLKRNIRWSSASQSTFQQEYRARLKNGEWVWMLEVVAPRFNSEGRPIGQLKTLLDITPQKAREDALKRKHRHLEEEILRISEWERTRVGRDLHDTLSQLLLGVSLKTMLLEEKLQERELPEFYAAREVAAEIGKIISTTRKLSQFLFPVTLTKKDFLEAIEDLSGQAQTLFGARLIFDFQDEMEDFDPEKALQLYRIIQEALTNAVRHGGAKRIQVSFKSGTNGRRMLEIRDDGAYRDSESSLSTHHGLGLHIIEYRAKTIGGDFEIGRTAQGGFVLSCHYPVSSPVAKDKGEEE